MHLLLPLFEKFLDEAPDDVSYDQVRQSVVILMGTLARHLDKEDHRVKPIVKKLIDTLATPSQQVGRRGTAGMAGAPFRLGGWGPQACWKGGIGGRVV